ncbi:hypothetical protein CRUP_013046 [Coryphaenoides rupestris]|nr:hypothetical protein CRUP_013046 [Coryphaenoides rupestris]
MYKIRQKTTTFNTADSLQVENSQAREILIRRHPTIRRSIRAGSFRDQSVPKSQRYYSLQAGANLDSAFPLRRTSHGSDITELRERRLHALQPEAVTARPRPHSPGLDVIDEIRGDLRRREEDVTRLVSGLINGTSTHRQPLPPPPAPPPPGPGHLVKMNQTATVSHQSKCQTRNDVKEFVDVSPPQRNWKGIAISLLVIVGVCSLISMSVILLSPAVVPGGKKSRASVSDLYSSEFAVHDPPASWVSDSEVVYRDHAGHVVKFNFILNETEVLLRNKTFVDFKAVKYSLSPDLKFALLAYDVNQLYIFENNLYYQAGARSSSLRVTSSGADEGVFNGIADWLYEEEILKSNMAYWWSPDGERLAFLTINDTLVPNMPLPRFTGSAYPRGLHYPYPMRHEEISEAWLTMQDRQPWFSRDRSRLFLTLPVKQGGQGDFQHISMLIKKLRSDQNEVRHLTSGDWEVTRILSYDENNQIIVSTLGLFPRRCRTCGLKRGCMFFDADGYGGYVALEMLTTTTVDKSIHCAAVRAPVIDWSMYASAFSERYLGSPSADDQVYQLQLTQSLIGYFRACLLESPLSPRRQQDED